MSIRKTVRQKTILHRALAVVTPSTRETDLVGYKKDAILAVIFTEVDGEENGAFAETLRAKIAKVLRESLSHVRTAKSNISLLVLPEDWNRERMGWLADSKLYPALESQVPHKKVPLAVKRAIDIVGSVALLVLLSCFCNHRLDHQIDLQRARAV